ncbi:hypothetical protein [uncultured Brevibacillus sp.]|uniref:hypothetical protein n=1 Tax=uncultured Brevibacillus sp. TaxID=169970 RepID=UPI0025986910|nr:hypothetical protein [uncultured Brevibacillus sp.]
MPKNIFRRLTEALDTVSGKIHSGHLHENELDLEEKKLAALVEITKYVKSLDFLSHEKTKERLRYFFNSRFNYRSTALYFECGLNKIESAVSYAGKTLERKIGSGTIEMILESKNEKTINMAISQFRIGIGQEQPDEWFISDMAKRFPKAEKSSSLTIEECRTELAFLGYCTKHFYEKELAKLDKRKLAFLLYVLNSVDGKVALERSILLGFIKGKLETIRGVSLNVGNQVDVVIGLLQLENPLFIE